MKKAIVIGGSRGIGLALASELISQGIYVHIFDVQSPLLDSTCSDDKYCFHCCDLTCTNYDELKALKDDNDICELYITAGLGRVCKFEDISPAEIDRIMKVNSLAMIRIIKIFYSRMLSKTPFYTGVMGSIAGLVSSPMFAVYAASKAAVCRFVESINIELEKGGTENRILNVSPGSIKGTCFNGGETDLQGLKGLSNEIIEKTRSQECLFIPEYDIFKRVLDDYQRSPHDFGVQSYEYKIKSGRITGAKKEIVGYLSGTFDLFHVGHLNLLKRAKEECDYLIVGVHKDASHKGKETFIPFEERMKIVSSIKYVDQAVESCREDSDAWDLWHYDKLFVGSDYKGTERFNRYEKMLGEKGVEIVYFPYTKGTSSTQIREMIIKKNQ